MLKGPKGQTWQVVSKARFHKKHIELCERAIADVEHSTKPGRVGRLQRLRGELQRHRKSLADAEKTNA
jgi:hypothetical protein